MSSLSLSYNISRPYPYPWFTPLMIVGTIVLTVLFSFVNLAANGYYMKTVYTNDPNTTLKEGQKWFLKAPFNWGSRLEPTCQPRLISVGDQLFTTNLGFMWSVTSLSQSSDNAPGSVSLPSIPYLNNTLENCHVESVNINLVKADLAIPPSWWISWSPSYCITKAVCTISSELGPANITVQNQYQVGGDLSHDYVVQDNFTTHASTWWGVELLNAYWIGLEAIMSLMNPNGNDTQSEMVMRGSLAYTWNNTDRRSIRDLDFFGLTFYLLSANSLINNDYGDLLTMYNDRSSPLSYITLEGLHFAKIMHSLLAVDFGNTNVPNFLTDEDDLKYILAAPDDPNRQPGGDLYDNSPIAGWGLLAEIPPPVTVRSADDGVLINESYTKFESQVGPLGTKNATFYSQYACSIPAQRSTGTMLIAILIADLVFLQAAWKLCTLITDATLRRQDPRAMYCQGCAKGGYDAIGLQNLKPNRSGLFNRRPGVKRGASSTEVLLATDNDVR